MRGEIRNDNNVEILKVNGTNVTDRIQIREEIQRYWENVTRGKKLEWMRKKLQLYLWRERMLDS